jgi:hypothetical protein
MNFGMDVEGRSESYLKVLSQNLPSVIEENCEHSQSEESFSKPRFIGYKAPNDKMIINDKFAKMWKHTIMS